MVRIAPSATKALIHIQEGLDVKNISKLYTETQTVNPTRTRLKEDDIVIDANIVRESEYTRNRSTCVDAEGRYQAAVDTQVKIHSL